MGRSRRKTMTRRKKKRKILKMTKRTINNCHNKKLKKIGNKR